MIKTKTGAMFGLDARIALAIFGALSVISSAALYSAIQQTQATSVLSDLKEVGKAWETYYIDTSENLQKTSNDNSTGGFYTLKADQLIENPGISGWSGPYLPYVKITNGMKHSIYGNIYIFTLTNEDWSTWTTGTCTNGKQCFIWSLINGFKNEAVAKNMDQIVDNSDGKDKGSFRWNNYSADKYEYLLKIAPIKNPND